MSIDLAKLPAPTVVESLSFDAVVASMRADLAERAPELANPPVSDPLSRAIEVFAYRELLLRARVNEAARQTMLAYATGANLDHVAAPVERLVLDPGDPDATPPVAPTYETDDALRARAATRQDEYSTAGPRQAYRYHALAASGDVIDARATSPAPGEVVVYILADTETGAAGAELLDLVETALNDQNIRPMCDTVSVKSATIIVVDVVATLYLYPGPDAETVRAAAEARALAYMAAQHRLGHDLARSGLFAALHVAGVQRVELASPTDDIEVGDGEASHCTGVTVTVGGTNE